MQANSEIQNQILFWVQSLLHEDSKVRLPAEQSLQQVKHNSGFLIILLQIIEREDIDITIRQSAAVYFKNHIKAFWSPDSGESPISGSDMDLVKTNIVQLMLSVPKLIQSQISESLTIISSVDFPHRWNNLLPQLISLLSSLDYHIINGILSSINAICSRYRYEFKSETLWKEIAYVLETFQETFLYIYQHTISLFSSSQNNMEVLLLIIDSLTLQYSLFYSLSAQDIPAFFQDHMVDFFNPMISILSYQNPLFVSKLSQHTQTEYHEIILMNKIILFLSQTYSHSHLLFIQNNDVPSTFDSLRTQICEVLTLYSDRYEPEFRELVPTFVEKVWSLLISCSYEGRYDELVIQGMSFLVCVVKKDIHKDLFSNTTILQQIVEKVIIQNIKLRDSDIETFEFNGEDYVRCDIEDSDIDTRRRLSMDLVHGICRYFENEITNIMHTYISTLLSSYNENPNQNFLDKDTAIYLLLALTVKGVTEQHGATQTNPLINIIDFFENHILPELVDRSNISINISSLLSNSYQYHQDISHVNDLPIIKSDCLKFISVFRSHFPVEAYPLLLSLSIKYLHSEVFVVHTYASHCIERLLTVKNLTNNQPYLSANQISPFLNDLYTILFKILEYDSSTENEYIMKCIMRVTSCCSSVLINVREELLSKFTKILFESMISSSSFISIVAKNPKKPQFRHFLFESIAICINSYSSSVPIIEQLLWPPFQSLLSSETCEEFQPYLFQLLNQILSLQSEPSNLFQHMFTNFLSPALYEHHANHPPLMILISTYVSKISNQLVKDTNLLMQVLGCWQKVISSRSNDRYAIDLLHYFYHYLSEYLNPFLEEIIRILLFRYHKSLTEQFKNLILYNFSYFIHKFGFNKLYIILEKFQNGLTYYLFQNLWMTQGKKLINQHHQNMVVVGIIDILMSDIILESNLQPFWFPLLSLIIHIFESNPEKSEEKMEEVWKNTNLYDDNIGYSSGYRPLMFIPNQHIELLSDISSNDQYFCQNLSLFVQKYPSHFSSIQSYLSQFRFSSLLKGSLIQCGLLSSSS